MGFKVKWQPPGEEPVELFESEDIRLAIDEVRKSRREDDWYGPSDTKTWLEDGNGNIIPVVTNPEDDEPVPGGGF